MGDRLYWTHSTTWKENWCRCIITAKEYLTKRVEAQQVKDYTWVMLAKLLFEHFLTRFGCLKVFMSDRGTHFLNETISTLTDEF